MHGLTHRTAALSLLVFLGIAIGPPIFCHQGWGGSAPQATTLAASSFATEASGSETQRHWHTAFSHCRSECGPPESILSHLAEGGSIFSAPFANSFASLSVPEALLPSSRYYLVSDSDDRQVTIIRDIVLPFSNAPPCLLEDS